MAFTDSSPIFFGGSASTKDEIAVPLFRQLLNHVL